MPSPLKEALEKIKAEYESRKTKFPDEHTAGMLYAFDIAEQIIEDAIAEDNKWRVPDDATHPFALLWFTYPGARGWSPTCNSESDLINEMFRGVTFVIAKENQGPPQDDWRPGEHTDKA